MKTARVAIAFGLIAAAMLLGCKDAAEQHNAAHSKPRPTKVAPIRPAAADRHRPDVDVARPAPRPDFAPVRPNALPPMGYVPNKVESQRYINSLPQPFLQQAAPHLFRARGPPQANYRPATERKPVLLYRALLQAYKLKYGREFVVGTQKIGDCTSWGWSHGIDIIQAIDFLCGRSGDFHMVATEATYGLGRVEGAGLSHNRSGDGSYGAAMAKGATRYGVLFRLDYSSLGRPEYDLRTYSGAKARDWGEWGCGGRYDGGVLDEIARQHKLGQVAIVDTFDAAAAAIENGYAVPVCSGQGFTSTRDAQGFLRPWGSWPHCMCFVGVRYDRPGLLCLNSWGPSWVNGGYWPTFAARYRAGQIEMYQFDNRNGDPRLFIPTPSQLDYVGDRQLTGQYITGPKSESDMPDGSFWVDASVVNSMLRGRDSYAVSNLVGFPRQELHLIKGL